MEQLINEHSKNIHEDVILSCLQGNVSSYEQLYKLYSRAMLNVAFRILNDISEAEDVLQESFIKAFNNLSSYKGDSTFGAWLKRIVINQSLNQIRKQKLQFEDVDNHQNDLLSDDSDDFGYEKHLKVARIRQAMEKLPDGYRIIFSLYLLEGYDHAEIASILGISESTSKSQLNRSKKKIKEILTFESDEQRSI